MSVNENSGVLYADHVADANARRGMRFGASEKAVSVFQAAQRHSTRVKILKIGLPIAAVLVGAVFSWFTFLATPASTVKVNLGDGLEDGKLVMANPNLNGFTKENRPYNLTATKAIQDVKNEGIITLEGISAKLPVGAQSQATINAKNGVYDNVNGRMKLIGDFVVTTTDGLTAKMRSADVNIATGQIMTDNPVDIQSGTTHIQANKMQVQSSGDVVVFEDEVHLTIVAPESVD
ncbi:LPS export ABC transporter periplasmic protein LptC [Paenochrobactrum sp. BZR 588]|uniref:LPS export ABC transporter periplasmic protein LptC n=1 Tax=unclassified Paenochrobactrum TaxID=2639760 RepID=UPI003852C392